jgi:hypothetical protein
MKPYLAYELEIHKEINMQILRETDSHNNGKVRGAN